MTKRMAISALALAGAFLASYLTLYKLGYIGTLACGTGGCETVQMSKWGNLAGQPVALWGVGFYVAMFALATLGTFSSWAEDRRVSIGLVAMSGWGVLFSAWLTWLELFKIQAICRFCVGSALIVLVLFVLSLLDLRDFRRAS